MRTVLAIAALLITAASCSSYVCSAATCAAGCCENNNCYDGVPGKTGGVSCSAGGGAQGTGGGTGGGGGSSATGGGTGGGGSCGSYDDPCNASLPCCTTPVAKEAYTCNASRERCDFCGAAGYDCSSQYSDPCCPGFSCQLKSGFSSVYECQ